MNRNKQMTVGLAVVLVALTVMVSASLAQERRQITHNPERSTVTVRELTTRTTIPRGDTTTTEPSAVKIPAQRHTIGIYCHFRGQELVCGESSELSCPPTFTFIQPDGTELTCDLDCHGNEPDPYAETCECDVDIASCE